MSGCSNAVSAGDTYSTYKGKVLFHGARMSSMQQIWVNQ